MNIFLLFLHNNMRTATYVFMEKKNINTFCLKEKNTLSRVMFTQLKMRAYIFMLVSEPDLFMVIC